MEIDPPLSGHPLGDSAVGEVATFGLDVAPAGGGGSWALPSSAEASTPGRERLADLHALADISEVAEPSGMCKVEY